MGSHPINLTIRFLLELAALGAIGMWGYKQSDTWWRFVLAIGFPVLFAIIWGVFNVPNDPSRSGAAPVVTPGFIRLLIELCVFGNATWALYSMGYTTYSIVFAVIVILHYIVSYDRILWLLSK